MLGQALGSPAILSSVGARLLINMKEAGAKGWNEGMGSSAGSKATVSGMDFAAPPAQTSVASRVGGEEELGMVEEIEMIDVSRVQQGHRICAFIPIPELLFRCLFSRIIADVLRIIYRLFLGS